MRRFVIRALASAALLLSTSWQASRAADAYDINVILPLSGGAAFIGQTHEKELRALEGVVNKQGGINGRPVHFVFADDQTSPQVAVQLATTLIARHPPIVMGSNLTAMCRAMEPLFKSGPVQYCLSPGIHPAKDAYSFATSINTTDLLAATMRFFRDKGWTRIAVMTTTDASGQDGDVAVRYALGLPENKAIQTVDTEHYNPTDVNVTAQLAKMRAAKPQAVIVWVSGTPFGTALRGMSETGLDLPVVSSSANMVTSQLKQYAGYMPKALYFPGVSYAAGVASDPRVQKAQRIWADAIEAVGMTTDLQSGLAWDPANIVISALRHVGPNATAEQIHHYIETLHDWPGISGVYDFRDGNQRGLTMKDVVMIRWDPIHSAWVASSKLGGGLK